MYSPVKQNQNGQWMWDVTVLNILHIMIWKHTMGHRTWPMNKYYNLQYSHIFSRVFFLSKISVFFWIYMCYTMDDVRQSQLLMNISKYSLQTCNKICDICAHITRRKMLLVLCVFSSTAIVQLCRFVLLFKRNCHPKGVCINWSSISQESTNVKILNQGQDARSVWSLVICTAHTHTVEGGAACNSKYKQIPNKTKQIPSKTVWSV